MRCLQVKEGKVSNVAIFDSPPAGWIKAPLGVGVGFIDNGGGTFSPPVKAAVAIPDATTCSKLQMLEELADLGKEEDLFSTLDGNEQMMRRWNAATSLSISHPMVEAMALVLGYDSAQMQVVFNSASKRSS